MGAWLKDFWTDQAKFVAAMRALVFAFGVGLTYVPAEILGGLGHYGKFGMLLGALAMAAKAGDRNRPALSPEEMQALRDQAMAAVREEIRGRLQGERK